MLIAVLHCLIARRRPSPSSASSVFNTLGSLAASLPEKLLPNLGGTGLIVPTVVEDRGFGTTRYMRT